MKTVVLVGTLDTKGAEYAFLRDRLHDHGVATLLVDAGIYEPQLEPTCRAKPLLSRRARTWQRWRLRPIVAQL